MAGLTYAPNSSSSFSSPSSHRIAVMAGLTYALNSHLSGVSRMSTR